MNKYSVRLPYNYLQYGYLTGYVYAEDEEEAYDLASDSYNIRDPEYEDTDGDSTEFNYSDVDIELEDEDVDEVPAQRAVSSQTAARENIPSYFLSEVHSL